MLTISACRPGAFSRWVFGEPRILGTAYVGQAAINALSTHTFCDRVLILVPGYNNSEQDAVQAGLSIESILKARGMLGPGLRYEELVVFAWPGRSAPGYWIAEDAARKSGEKLRGIIAQLECDAVSVQTHSLGALVWCAANENGELAGGVQDVILANAAIDDESIEAGQPYAKAMNVRGRVLVAYSRQDPVLAKAYRYFGSAVRNLASLLQFKLAGDFALGFSGPEHPSLVPSNVECWDGTEFCTTHSGFRTSPEYYRRWDQLPELHR